MLKAVKNLVAGKLTERQRGLVYRLLFIAGAAAFAFGLATDAQVDHLLALAAEVLGTGLASANTEITKEADRG